MEQAPKTGIMLRQLFVSIQGQWGWGLFFVLFIVQSIMVNGLVTEFRLAKRQTYLPSISFILCLFLFAGSDVLSPALIANFLILLALNNLYQAYDKKNSILEVFNAGFFVAIAALIYLPTLWYFLFILIAWFSLRSFNIKELIILLSALFSPLFLMGTWQFINNNLQNWWQSDFVSQWTASKGDFMLNIPFWISIALLASALIWSLLSIQRLKSKTTIREQKFINVLYWLLLTSVISLLGQRSFFMGQNMGHFALVALPLGILFSLHLQTISSNRLAGWVHFVFLLGVLIVQYYDFLLVFINELMAYLGIF